MKKPDIEISKEYLEGLRAHAVFLDGTMFCATDKIEKAEAIGSMVDALITARSELLALYGELGVPTTTVATKKIESALEKAGVEL